MTTYQLFLTALFFSLALFALLRSWKHYGRRQVGIAIMVCGIVSNFVYWGLAPEWRPPIFSFMEVIFALFAAKAGKETDSRVAVGLIGFSLVAFSASTAFSMSAVRTTAEYNFYALILNVVFTGQCLLIGFWGAVDELIRTRRLPWRAVHGRGAPELASDSTDP